MSEQVYSLSDHTQTIESQLKPSAVIAALLIFFGLTAIILIFSVDMSVLLKTSIGLLVVIRLTVSLLDHVRGAIHGECQAVRIAQNKWLAVLQGGHEESLDVLRISNVIGLGYNLKVRMRSSGKVHFINFWRQHTNETFLRYLGQVKAYGLVNTDQA